MLKIAKVQKRGLGYYLGLEKGDEILSFNGVECVDELDYAYLLSSTSFSMTVRGKQGNVVTVQVEKEAEESLGIEFEKEDRKKKSRNSCELRHLRRNIKNPATR